MRPDLESVSKTEWELATARAAVLAPMADAQHCVVEDIDRAAAQEELIREEDVIRLESVPTERLLVL